MPRACTVCRSAQIQAINRALATPTASYRATARQYGLSKDALIRHAKGHLPPKLAKAQEARESFEAGVVLAEVMRVTQECKAKLDSLPNDAKCLKEWAIVQSVLHKNLKLCAAISGELSPTTHQHLHLPANSQQSQESQLPAMTPEQVDELIQQPGGPSSVVIEILHEAPSLPVALIEVLTALSPELDPATRRRALEILLADAEPLETTGSAVEKPQLPEHISH